MGAEEEDELSELISLRNLRLAGPLAAEGESGSVEVEASGSAVMPEAAGEGGRGELREKLFLRAIPDN